MTKTVIFQRSAFPPDGELLELLNYRLTIDCERGRLFWKTPPPAHKEKEGQEAGTKTESRKKAYWIVQVDYLRLKRSHIIFLASYHRLPKPLLDHINGNSLDDRINNLREATVLQNCRNRSPNAGRTMPMGVRLNANRYEARITHNGRSFFIGGFSTAEEAALAYQAKRKELFGEFA